MKNNIHIIVLDVPYPANYGGAIDAYYLIKALHSLGFDITLHCFEYGNRRKQTILNNYCKNVFYYNRKNYFQFLFSKAPFIIASRTNNKLIKNLMIDESPIIFEGIHTTSLLNHPSLINRKKIVRTFNIETNYYNQLAIHETNFFKKKYYLTESKRLLNYEKSGLSNSSIACIAKQDLDFFKKQYPLNKVELINPFHPFSKIEIELGKGTYCLYHGNLSVAENEISALWLIENIFNEIDIPLIIAGANPSNSLKNIIKNKKNITLIQNPININNIIKNAQINVLPSFQNTGFKLKLLHALYVGRHCLLNNLMLTGTNLHSVCTIAETIDDWKKNIHLLFNKQFDKKDVEFRKSILENQFNVYKNAENMIKLI